MVLHLLNRSYNLNSKRVDAQGPFQIRVDRKIFNGGTVESAIYQQSDVYGEREAPDSSSVVKLKFRMEEGELIIEVPSMAIWRFVELSAENPLVAKNK